MYEDLSNEDLELCIKTYEREITDHNDSIARLREQSRKWQAELGRRTYEMALTQMWKDHPGLQLNPGDLLDSHDYLKGDEWQKPIALVVDSILPADASVIVKTWYDPKLEFLSPLNKPRYWSGLVELDETRQMREAYMTQSD